jgi:cellulose synthase/poly-beta-1,6-N-acetylglucosamine synthase-like glycosyltransferase
MANSNPVVSVIIPTYLEEETLEGCLTSVLNQEFGIGRIESIVVDSHSRDNTQAIAKKYADKVLDLQTRGVGKARNAGARIARSPILLFLDADTYLESHFIAEIYRNFTDPRVVCVSGILKNLETLKPLDRMFAISHYGFLNLIATITAKLGVPAFSSVCCSCRKSAFDQMGGFAEDLAVAEDITFSRQMGRVGKCMVNRKAIAYTSVRRISNCGKIEMYSMYFKNYIRVFILNQKPWIQDFPHIR